MTKFLTSARLWVALRLSLAIHFALLHLRAFGSKVLDGIRWLVRCSYATYLLIVTPLIPVYALVCLLDAAFKSITEVFEFLRDNIYSYARWKREVTKLKPSVPAPATPGAPGGHNSGVNPPKQAR